MQHGREVSVTRKQDELLEARLVGQHVANIHHHADVGGILELGRERRAVDDFETGTQEVVPHERKRVHVRRIIARVPARNRIAVAPAHDDATRLGEARSRRRRNQAPAFDLAQPQGRVLGEPLGCLFILPFQRQVDVVVIDKYRTENSPGGLHPHILQPRCAHTFSIGLHCLRVVFQRQA